MDTETKNVVAYVPTDAEQKAQRTVLDALTTGRSTLQKQYNHFNGRNLKECIDDWTKRWNSWIPAESELDETAKSRVFLSFTRNAIINYLSNIALNPPRAVIKAINKKLGTGNKVFAQFLSDLKKASEDNENYSQKFLQFGIELATKGTAIMYEGYLKEEQETKLPISFDAVTGEIEYKKGTRVTFDDCYARVVPIEDFYIPNPYQADVQKQPWVLWREITQYGEAEVEYGHYKNFQKVQKGAYAAFPEPNTFYREQVQTEIGKDGVEILRYYERLKNRHIVVMNGVVIYNGPIPFKDGRYPFAKSVFEPFANDFFWGAGYPHKIQGEQDAQNTSFNLMMDKFYASLLPFGLSSDLDDFIEDETLQPNRIRKVGDVNKWSFTQLPGVSAGEQNMFQTILGLARENSGSEGGANAFSPKGGKLQVRQVLLKQQEAMKKLGFSASFMEDFEKNRTELRLSHILQFYSIPKIEKITGKRGKEVEQLIFRDVQLSGVSLSDGRKGNKLIKVIGEDMTDDERVNLANELSVVEESGELSGVPVETLAVHIDTFQDFNYSVEIEPYSSFERNQVLDQASRQEYANWRLSMQQFGVPVDAQELVAWVDESYDVDSDRFTPQVQSMNQMSMMGQQPQMAMQGQLQSKGPAQMMAPKMSSPFEAMML